MADVFRKEYKPLSDEQKAQIAAIKDMAENLDTLFSSIGSSREMSIAKTNLEQSIMWAVKAITL